MDATTRTTTSRRQRRIRLALTLTFTALLSGVVLSHAHSSFGRGPVRGEAAASRGAAMTRQMAPTWGQERPLPQRALSRQQHPMRTADSADGAAFARWLAHTPDTMPLAPGLVGRVADGTEVRLHLYDGAPADGGTLLATLTFVAGSDDASSFQATVREVAVGASHVVVDVLGRTVALPAAGPADPPSD